MRDWSIHTPYSEPGRHRLLLQQLPDRVDAISAAARNVIGHYRAELADLPEQRRDEINSRWLEVILDLDQDRHSGPLDEPRDLPSRVAGCCRDHSLFVVGALRERRIPARNRVGFAGYLLPGYHLDHVIVEYWDQTRWRRTDPEQRPGTLTFDPTDMPAGPKAPFQTAAEVWRGYRNRDLDPSRYCIYPGSDLSGPSLVRTDVIFETAHRCGDELLLWDGWGITNRTGDEDLIDRLADLLVRADAGDQVAERDLADQYANDDRIHPGGTVTQYSPFGAPPQQVRLRQPAS